MKKLPKEKLSLSFCTNQCKTLPVRWVVVDQEVYNELSHRTFRAVEPWRVLWVPSLHREWHTHLESNTYSILAGKWTRRFHLLNAKVKSQQKSLLTHNWKSYSTLHKLCKSVDSQNNPLVAVFTFFKRTTQVNVNPPPSLGSDFYRPQRCVKAFQLS